MSSKSVASSYLKPEWAHLAGEYAAVVQCNRCGFCETACPTYVASGKETLSPRGRNQAFRQILEGALTNPKEAAEVFSTCLTCHACTNVCFSQVPVAELMAQARAIVNHGRAPKLLERFIFRFLLPVRARFSILIWFGFLARRLGLSSLLKKARLLKILSPELDAAEELLEEVPVWLGPGRQTPPPVASARRILHFSGCGIHYLFPQAARAVREILSRDGGAAMFPNRSCCGLPAHSAGDLDNARRMAKHVMRQCEELKADVVLVDDDSCAGFLKHYPRLFPNDPAAAAFAAKVKDLAEFLTEDGRALETDFATGDGRGKITYHDPCQMGNAYGQTEAPRKIIRDLAAGSFVEMEESGWCCGGAGTYCLKHPRLAEDVLERKLANIRSSGAGTVLTQASSCLLHIGTGVRKKGWEKEIRVLHLAEWLAGKKEG